ncbi:hypothetical protein EAH_00067650, partial [Eimeria acervulina]
EDLSGLTTARCLPSQYVLRPELGRLSWRHDGWPFCSAWLFWPHDSDILHTKCGYRIREIFPAGVGVLSGVRLSNGGHEYVCVFSGGCFSLTMLCFVVYSEERDAWRAGGNSLTLETISASLKQCCSFVFALWDTEIAEGVKHSRGWETRIASVVLVVPAQEKRGGRNTFFPLRKAPNCDAFIGHEHGCKKACMDIMLMRADVWGGSLSKISRLLSLGCAIPL